MPCPRTQQANLPACSPQPSRNAKCQAGKLRIPFFKVFWYDSTRGMNPRSTDYKADALTTTPLRHCYVYVISKQFFLLFTYIWLILYIILCLRPHYTKNNKFLFCNSCFALRLIRRAECDVVLNSQIFSSDI